MTTTIRTDLDPPICADCGNEIEPDTCHCGSDRKDHIGADNHAFVPIGCFCFTDHDPKKGFDE